MEEDTVLYPSVTVCKKYTFDTYLDYMFENKDINLTVVKELVIAVTLYVSLQRLSLL